MPRILSAKEYERMSNNGWDMISIHMVRGEKRDNQIKGIKAYYSKIKEYYMTTRVKGYYNDVWACKR